MSSRVLNMCGGGASGFNSTDAVLRVIAPTGSTITVSFGGTSKTLTPTAISGSSAEKCYYDIVKPSAFSSTARTITATLNGDTVTSSVTINAAGEYTVTISFWSGELYVSGNQYTEHTGGWEAKSIRFSDVLPGTSTPVQAAAPTLDTSGNTMVATVVTTGTTNKSGSVLTANKIDLTDFDRITFVTNHYYASHSRIVRYYVTSVDTASGGTYTPAAETENINSGDQTVVVDVSSLTGEYYVGFNLYAGSTSGGTTTVTITSIIAS